MKLNLFSVLFPRYFGSWLMAGFWACCALTTTLQGQTDTFDDNADNGWTRYNPLGNASYTLNNGTYRLRCPANTTTPALGPARSGSLFGQPYTDFYASVDVVSWNDDIDQAFGLLGRLTNPGLQTSVGYAFTYRRNTGASGGDLDISVITEEAPDGVTVTGNDKFHFVPGQIYRMVFIGKADALEARVYQLPDVLTPVVRLTGNNDHYSSGQAGVVIYDPVGTLTPDATFDNFFVGAVEPPRLEVSYNVSFNELTVSWLTNAGPFHLQGTINLSAPSVTWENISPAVIFQLGDRFTYAEEPLEKLRVFRLSTQ